MIFSFIKQCIMALVNTINQLPEKGARATETPYHRNHPWERKKVNHPHSAHKDRLHGSHALGSPNTDARIFNHPRR